MDKLKQHWTEGSIQDFVFRIASDFVLQIEKKLDTEEMSRAACGTASRDGRLCVPNA